MKNLVQKIMIVGLVSLMSTVSFAANKGASQKGGDAHHMHKGEHHHGEGSVVAKAISKDKVLIQVQGMVCAFCAQGIEKNFNAKKEVQSTKVDLDKMEVLVTFNKGQSLNEEAIKQIVTDAGFKYLGVK